MGNFEKITQDYIRMIDDSLDEYLVKTGDKYDIVKEAMSYSLKAGGKRIRPILTLEFCRINGGDINKALPLACAIEMIHCYSLIHDDLPCMDDDDLRRGKPSCHKKFGESNALLAGDALLTLAFDVVASASKSNIISDNICVNAIKTLAYYSGIDGMIGGQVMDLMFENQPMDEQILHQIHLKKTAALIKASCKLGSIAAEASEEKIKNSVVYGENLGFAFQIVDDILDVVGDEKSLGKPVGSDKQNGKTTFVTIYGLNTAKEIAHKATQTALEILKQYESYEYLEKLTNNLLLRTN